MDKIQGNRIFTKISVGQKRIIAQNKANPTHILSSSFQRLHLININTNMD